MFLNIRGAGAAGFFLTAIIATSGCSAQPSASSSSQALAPINIGDLQQSTERQTVHPTSAAPARPSSQQPAPMPGGAQGLAPLENDLLNALAVSTSTFDVRPGETLRAVLTRWTQDAGWQLVWQSSKDYKIEAGVTFPRGTTMQQALRETVHSVWMVNPTIKVELYKNNVLVVTEVKA